LIGAIIVAFILSEQAYRVYLYGSAAFSYTRMNSIHPMGTAGLVRASEDPEIIYELKPGLDKWFKGVEFRTNSIGLRDREYSREKPRNMFRVAVVGDSFTMPAGVRIENAFHSLIEAENAGQEWINFGVGGYTLRQYRAVVTHRLAAWNPDLILICFCRMNDHITPPEEIFHEPYQPKPVSRMFFESALLAKLKQVRDRINKRSNRLKSSPVNTGEGEPSGVVVPDGNGIDNWVIRQSVFSTKQESYMADMFSDISTFSHETGIPVVVACMSMTPDPAYRGSLKRLVIARDLGFVDLTQLFPPNDYRKYWVFRNDPHPNAAAHRIFADALAEELVRQSALDGCSR